MYMQRTMVSSKNLTFRGSSICRPAEHLFHGGDLVRMIEKARKFHQQGGNLASIEHFLDNAMQSTLDRLDLKFEFTDSKGLKATESKDSVKQLQEYFKTHDIPRGGYGQPLPGKYVGPNARKGGPLKKGRFINVLEPDDTAEKFRAAIGHVGPKCLREVHFAEKSYEEKLFCVPENPQHIFRGKDEFDEECNIFSIGSNDQWGFEQEVIEKLPNCVVHTFDCTLKDNKPRKKPNSDNIHFYPYCISGDRPVAADFLSYLDIWKQTNTTKAPRILKIDVEGFEFDVLPSLLRESPPDIWPEQIMIEIHWATRMVGVSSVLRTRSAAEISFLFGNLFTFGGYLPVEVKYFEPECPTCLEVLFVRVVCDAQN